MIDCSFAFGAAAHDPLLLTVIRTTPEVESFSPSLDGASKLSR
jgi:hypothetical protein